MLQMLRRAGIAIGSLVAAWLVMSLLGGVLLPFVGVPFRPLDPATTTTGSIVIGLIIVVLGGLIYRDIRRRERRRI
jgi:CBS domain containing-hemolysin-like protein